MNNFVKVLVIATLMFVSASTFVSYLNFGEAGSPYVLKPDAAPVPGLTTAPRLLPAMLNFAASFVDVVSLLEIK